jgi:hypothetical protein
MDSTHISFGVVTVGLFTDFAKLEASWFNGREPDDDRWDFDLDTLDSLSTRLSLAFGEEWSFQASYGYLASPHELDPGTAVRRITASGSYTHTWSEGRAYSATTLAWGRNVEEHIPVPTDSVILESTLDPTNPLLVYGRLSRDVKTAEDLVVDGFDDDETFDLYTASAGLALLFPIGDHVETGFGVRGNVSLLPNDLEPIYGTRTPAGLFAYVQLRPPPTSSSTMHHDHRM